MTRDLLEELTHQEAFVVALYLRAGSLNKQQLYEYADVLRTHTRRQLLKIVLDTPASRAGGITIHLMASSFHPRRQWMRHRAQSGAPERSSS